MTNTFPNSQGRKVVLALVQTIVENKAHLSEVDGKIGDGDHGLYPVFEVCRAADASAQLRAEAPELLDHQ